MVQAKVFTLPTLVAAIGLLSACFVSDEPLIPEGEAVLPMDESMTLCVNRPDDCFTMIANGDTYVTADSANRDETGEARFYPLTQADGRQIYLLEAHDFEDDTYTYLIARRRSQDASGEADLDLALASCSDLSETQEAEFRAAGGQIGSGFGSECTAPDLTTLITTLRTAYASEFEDEDWWAEAGAN